MDVAQKRDDLSTEMDTQYHEMIIDTHYKEYVQPLDNYSDQHLQMMVFGKYMLMEKIIIAQ